MALGATQWQTIWKQVLPAAVPGIATGVILALARAIGETAPLIVIGAAFFTNFNPTSLDSLFTAMPIQIFDWISRPSNDVNNYQPLAAAGILLLDDHPAADEQRGHLATKSIRTKVVGDLEWRSE